MTEEDKFTLIQVKKTTAEKLKKQKIAQLETYDEIINRLLKQRE